MYPNTFYRVSVKALIRNDKGEVLVVKENQDTWSLPGGGLDHGEDPKDGLSRELLEELGINDASIHEVLTTCTFELRQKQAWLLWIVYDVTVTTETFKYGEGVVDVRFVDPAILRTSEDIFERQVYAVANSINK